MMQRPNTYLKSNDELNFQTSEILVQISNQPLAITFALIQLQFALNLHII